MYCYMVSKPLVIWTTVFLFFLFCVFWLWRIQITARTGGSLPRYSTWVLGKIKHLHNSSCSHHEGGIILESDPTNRSSNSCLACIHLYLWVWEGSHHTVGWQSNDIINTELPNTDMSTLWHWNLTFELAWINMVLINEGIGIVGVQIVRAHYIYGEWKCVSV